MKIKILLILIFMVSMTASQKIREFRVIDRNYIYEGTAIKYNKKFEKRFKINDETTVTSLAKNQKGNLYFKKINQSSIDENTYLVHGQLNYINIKTRDIIKKVDYEYGRVAGQIIEYDNKGKINKIENIKKGKKNGFTIEYDSTRSKTIKLFKDDVKKSEKKK